MNLTSRTEGDILIVELKNVVTMDDIMAWALQLPGEAVKLPPHGKVKLLVNFADAMFESRDAAALMQQGLKENPMLRDRIGARAMVAEPSPMFEAEKKALQTDTSQYFNSFSEALIWLSELDL